jgi:predicted RNase H-like HicB family nuclease
MTSAQPPSISAVLEFGEALTAAGYDPGPAFTKASAIKAAVETSLRPETYGAAENALDLDADDVVNRVRSMAVTIGLAQPIRDALWAWFLHLADAVRIDFAEHHADTVIAAMREKFDPAAAAVKAAAAAGLTPTTIPGTLVDTADTATLTAYRNLADAVRTLDGIAALRQQMTVMSDDPDTLPVAAFISSAASPDELDSAQATFVGKFQTVVVDLMGGASSAPVRTPSQRLGGPWLALVTTGHVLRLNTPSEAQHVIDQAHQINTPAPTAAGTVTTYTATASRDDGQWWTVTVPTLPNVWTQVRRISDVPKAAREAIAQYLKVPAETIVVELTKQGRPVAV